MRGQSSAEMMVLVAAILISVASMLYLGTGGNDSAVAMRAARDGAENAIAAIDAEYGCSIDIEELGFDAGTITISVMARNVPPGDFDWDNFRENIIENNIKVEALKHINNAFYNYFPATAAPVTTPYYTYDATVSVKRVTR